MKNEKSKERISFFSVLFVSLTLFFAALLCIFIFLYFRKHNLDFENALEDRNYHILVTGDYENNLFLSQVFLGAEELSADYNSIVELYVPQSYAQNESIQQLFDYASFANVDAVIAFIPANEDVSALKVPSKKEENPIPLITIGNYFPQIPQVAYIGLNYSEMGKKTAEEALAMTENGGTIFLVQGDLGNSTQKSNFMNSFHSAIARESAGRKHSHSVNFIDSAMHEYELMQTFGLTNDDYAVFITLNELDTVQTAQRLAAFTGVKTDIICVGNTEITESLFERGSIAEIIAVDPKEIGNAAIREIFEYLALRQSNNYITAGVQVRKAER